MAGEPSNRPIMDVMADEVDLMLEEYERASPPMDRYKFAKRIVEYVKGKLEAK